MTITFRSRRRATAECTHESQVRLEIAGMCREVCESCGRVTVSFVEDHFGAELPEDQAQDETTGSTD